MREVVINKDKLLKHLKENRDKHRELFEQATEGWQKAVLEGLEKQLAIAVEEARAGKKYRTHIALNLPQPVDHTKDYDDIIEAIEWHEDELITLSREEFRAFVRDEWGWKDDFISNSAMYGATL